jgi:hypothetical protein
VEVLGAESHYGEMYARVKLSRARRDTVELVRHDWLRPLGACWPDLTRPGCRDCKRQCPITKKSLQKIVDAAAVRFTKGLVMSSPNANLPLAAKKMFARWGRVGGLRGSGKAKSHGAAIKRAWARRKAEMLSQKSTGGNTTTLKKPTFVAQ